MKNILSSLLICCSSLLFGQFGPQQIITTNTIKPYFGIPVDVDNDGFIDVLQSSIEDKKLRWHKNMDGQGNFSKEILILETPYYYLSSECADLDTDGDIDILLLGEIPGVIFWLENLDGLGTFSSEQIILEKSEEYLQYTITADIDNDGDLDLISKTTNTWNDTVSWYENLDGSANFGEEHIILEDVIYTNVYPPLMIDMDYDGYPDILTAYEIGFGPARLVWFKNLGNGQFDLEREIYQFDFIISDNTSITNIKYDDINTDGKKDIVISAVNEDFGSFHYWFENLDDLGNFGANQNLGKHVFVICDIDNDGDNDMIASPSNPGNLSWWENTNGLGNFNLEHLISSEVDGLRYRDVADFNNDGLLDVISTSIGDNKIAWYENTGILGTEEFNITKVLLSPNPAGDWVQIHKLREPLLKVSAITIDGKIIELPFDENTINLQGVSGGLYFIRLQTIEGAYHTLKLVVE